MWIARWFVCALAFAATTPLFAQSSDTAELLAATRIARLPTGARAEWTAYVARSDTAQARDRALIDRELASIGRAVMDTAPFARESFSFVVAPGDNWLRSDSAIRIAESLVSFQTPSGGWSKHVDFTKGARRPGQSFFSENAKWQYIATIDNDATTSPIRFLLALDRARPDARWKKSAHAGLRYLISAQMPNGCWPQVWPLQGGYHDAITYKENSIIGVARLIDEVVAEKRVWLPDSTRRQLERANNALVECVLRTQVQRNGTRTLWGQQHDPLTLQPVAGRSYEPASLASMESAAILDWLITRPKQTAAIKAVVAAGAAWLKAHGIADMAFEMDRGPRAAPGEGPIWARLYSLDTGTPVFANRDGIVLTDFALLTDRRAGYAWYGTWPAATLRRIELWTRAMASPP